MPLWIWRERRNTRTRVQTPPWQHPRAGMKLGLWCCDTATPLDTPLCGLRYVPVEPWEHEGLDYYATTYSNASLTLRYFHLSAVFLHPGPRLRYKALEIFVWPWLTHGVKSTGYALPTQISFKLTSWRNCTSLNSLFRLIECRVKLEHRNDWRIHGSLCAANPLLVIEISFRGFLFPLTTLAVPALPSPPLPPPPQDQYPPISSSFLAPSLQLWSGSSTLVILCQLPPAVQPVS